MRIVFCVTGEISGTPLKFGDLVIIGDGRAPRAIVELDVDYGRLGMALMDDRLMPLSGASLELVSEMLALADRMAMGAPRPVTHEPPDPESPQDPAGHPPEGRSHLRLLRD
jgi:hypothetical protein